MWPVLGSVAGFVVFKGVDALGNLRKLPSEAEQAIHQFQSWYYDDSMWTGAWSSREEGDVQDYRQSAVPLELTVGATRGVATGEMFNRAVCQLNPLLPPVLLEGEIRSGKLVATAFVYQGGQKRALYSFSATRSAGEPVVTITPLEDPLQLLPAEARLVRRYEPAAESASASVGHHPQHPDLVCPEKPEDYIRRLRAEGKLKGGEQGQASKGPP